ncbi:hypothetical protein RAY_202 [Erwinia phage vB_EamM_RAY]|uniref:Tail fiber protein n=7 Tax=Agricanvirus TaxID=1984776 RepID=A0A173GEB2_9CAUD|nr:tail fiber protein [Erwinia phage Ea35-70]YP_009605668.1 tail fiber protein [Erwinia phage vB_EamM_RAY]YP_009605988.1 tail fiber protein [Erwinia phage vB_EamM_Simmy50]YP_009606310.1 tail fiber protein [Erwinia phage vB_EamM_Special G]AUG86632.1 hypothetical protein MADMEL_204 [Erwinia phage vB_EamM_MadMel]AUG86955.1 hypothetical protein MORTIMER_207 [Erwinia phage vB_EamM_Mortimer]QBP07309.1 hypothetical protein REBECCA_204 [Erwinia phage Rebecca]AHI60351.1 hypothetical protein Ea357_199
MSTEMTISRALATVKSLNVRIKDISKKQVLILPTAGTGDMQAVINNSITVTDAEAAIQNNWNALNDMIKVRNDIRAKIILSNATTKVTIAGKEYTIVEALDFRNSLVEKKDTVECLKRNYDSTMKVHRQQGDIYEKRLSDVRSEALASGKKFDEASLKTFTDPIDVKMKPGLIDPLGISAVIEKLDKEIADFELNADYALSESNATTKITVELGNIA